MAANLGGIMVEASNTRRHLRELCLNAERRRELGTIPEGVEVDESHLSDCLDRFNIWAGSLGVFQMGESSLDSRLANHALAREVVRLLRQLDQLVSDLKSIVDGDREQAVWTEGSLHMAAAEFSDSDDFLDEEGDGAPASPSPEVGRGPDLDGADPVMTESKDLHLSVSESITSLLRLSVQVHKASRRSKFARSSLDHDYAVEPDISHVRDFFPYAAANDALVERLGKANAQRRQWLWYRRRHREKLSVDFSDPAVERPSLIGLRRDDDDDEDDDGFVATSSVGEHPSAPLSPTGTKATTFRSQPTHTVLSQSIVPDTVFGRSSRATVSEPRLVVPETPPDLVLGQPYFCRYCCNVIEISGKNAWQKHVHSDLSSYTCTFDRCGEFFFESRRKWWAHEIEMHRNRWLCGICNSQEPHMAAMKDHLRREHPNQVPESQIEGMADRSRRPLDHMEAADCPLCDYASLLRRRGYPEQEIRHIPNEDFGRHLGRHLEQLALFVLPHGDLVDDQDGVSDSDGEDSASESGASKSIARPTMSGPDLIRKLSEVAAIHKAPNRLTEPPDLAMRWQPPLDFTPPLRDFDTDDANLLPIRQEPLYGGDLYTPGWARGLGDAKEGFCARCPVPHWVAIPDGSYRFHLTYFHGVPESGVPLPRPSTVRPVARGNGAWEGYCDGCKSWRTLQKTGRGWNWHRHWLNDHADIIRHRTEAIRNGVNPGEWNVERTTGTAAPAVDRPPTMDAKSLEAALRDNPDLLKDDEFLKLQLRRLVYRDEPQAAEHLVAQIARARSSAETRVLIDAADENGQTLLMASASQGLDRIVNLLLDLGADPNVADLQGRTALDCAADAGYFTMAQQLVDGGADASKASVLQNILLDERAYVGENTDPAEKGVSPSFETHAMAIAPLSRAVLEGNVDAVRRVLGDASAGPSRCDVEEGAEAGSSPFLIASIHGHIEIMELLLSRGANINATSKHGWTPLMLATKREDESCVSFLLSRGADANHLSPDRRTALAEAASRGLTSIAALLLEAGADPAVHAQSDWTPLMYAAYRGDMGTVDLLLQAGASFDDISARDETVMLLAAASGSSAVVRRLLDAGCSPEPLWSRMTTSPVVVGGGGSGETGEGVDTLKNLPMATTSQQRIERAYQVGWTPLMVACQVGSLDIAAMLLNAGANPEPKSPMFKTALEIAKENGRTELVSYLERRLGRRRSLSAKVAF